MGYSSPWTLLIFETESQVDHSSSWPWTLCSGGWPQTLLIFLPSSLKRWPRPAVCFLFLKVLFRRHSVLHCLVSVTRMCSACQAVCRQRATHDSKPGGLGVGVENSLSLGNCNQIQTSSGLFILLKLLKTPDNLCAFVSVGCPVLMLTVEGLKPKREMSVTYIYVLLTYYYIIYYIYTI